MNGGGRAIRYANVSADQIGPPSSWIYFQTGIHCDLGMPHRLGQSVPILFYFFLFVCIFSTTSPLRWLSHFLCEILFRAPYLHRMLRFVQWAERPKAVQRAIQIMVFILDIVLYYYDRTCSEI